MKSHFLLDPEVSYLNHGSFGACPKVVFEAYQQFQSELEVNPVQFMTQTGPRYLEQSKYALADYVHCSKEDIVYVPNPSTAISTVVKSLNLREGDEVLSTDQAYGAVDRTWRYYCQKTGARYVTQKIPLPLYGEDQFLAAFWRGLSSKTKVVCISHITSSTALQFPVEAVVRQARERGLMTIVDGAHVPGQFPLDLAALKPDVYVGACHKWLLAPKGSAFLYASKQVQQLLDPLVVSWGYEAQCPSDSRFQDHHQYQGTRDFSAFLTIPHCLQFMEQNNWSRRTHTCRKWIQHYYPIVADALGSAPICTLSDTFLGQMCSVPIKTTAPSILKNLLFDTYRIEIPIVDCAGLNTYLRLSLQPYNDEGEVEKLIDAIESIKSSTSLIES